MMRRHMRHLFNSLIEFLRSSKKTILLILLVASATLVLSTAISIFLNRFDNLHIPSISTIRTIGVEAYGGDINLTQDGKPYIDWGTIYVGASAKRSICLRSTSNVNTRLSLITSNWTPTNISAYMILSWNCTGTLISPDEEISVTLTLSAAHDDSLINYLITNNVKDFSFDIHIYAYEE